MEVHPANPQARFVSRAVGIIRSGGVITLSTDSGYAIVYALGNETGMNLIRQVRKLNERHNFSLLCHSFAQLGELILADNS